MLINKVAARDMVIYRSKMHAGLKRNFQVMPGAEWLELLCKHIPDRYEHLVRYVGWYSNRSRGARAAKAPAAMPASSSVTEVLSAFAQARAKAAWVRLIRKVYEADPLECPRCKGPMRVIALIDDPVEPPERAPPVLPEAWPAHASFALTYHPSPTSPEAAQKQGSRFTRAPALG